MGSGERDEFLGYQRTGAGYWAIAGLGDMTVMWLRMVCEASPRLNEFG